MIHLAIAEGIAVATLSRPPVNAINEEWVTRLREVLAQAKDWSVLLIRSDQKAFCAGADLPLMRSRFDSAEGREQMVALAREMQRAYAELEAAPFVSIAEISGAAMGGGLELALACDFRIAALEAKLGLPEVTLGLLPGAGGTQRLTRICGEAAAKRLILRGEVVGGEEAARLGVVQWAVPRSEVAAMTMGTARGIANLPRDAVAECKRCIAVALVEEGYEMELASTRHLLTVPETRSRVQAFLESRRQP
jgi:enoyl-CoA hydratase